MAELDVDEMVAQLLVTEGFVSIEEVAFVPDEELKTIEGFDEDIAIELQRRSRERLEAIDEEYRAQSRQLGVSEEIAQIEDLTPAMLVSLGQAGVKALDDLADLATDELIGPEDGVLRSFGLDEETANKIIMAARAHWFEDDPVIEVPKADKGGAEEPAASVDPG